MHILYPLIFLSMLVEGLYFILFTSQIHFNNYFSSYAGDSGIGFLFVRIAAGITTGTLAIFSAQPTDVVKVRMQAEVKKQGEKSQYKGVIDAYRTIAKTEGMKGLYKGIKICGTDE